MSPSVRLTAALHRLWQKKGLISTLLLPLSYLSRYFVQKKQKFYKNHPERQWKAPVPVIVVGNLFIGGTGKTPVVISVVTQLRQLGWHPGVISRGYGSKKTKFPRYGKGNLDPALFGDEPSLIASVTQAPVCIHPQRTAAAQTLLAHFSEVDILVLDDGLQHLKIARDIEIVVQDERGLGNGRLLPAGPLREPAERLDTVDIIINNHQNSCSTNVFQKNSFRPYCISMHLEISHFQHLNSQAILPWEAWQASYGQKPISALAGIGHPERFFIMLEKYGFTLKNRLALRDHAAINENALAEIDSEFILMTSKDAIKYQHIQDKRIWVVVVHALYSDNTWIQTMAARLQKAPLKD